LYFVQKQPVLPVLRVSTPDSDQINRNFQLLMPEQDLLQFRISTPEFFRFFPVQKPLPVFPSSPFGLQIIRQKSVYTEANAEEHFHLKRNPLRLLLPEVWFDLQTRIPKVFLFYL